MTEQPNKLPEEEISKIKEEIKILKSLKTELLYDGFFYYILNELNFMKKLTRLIRKLIEENDIEKAKRILQENINTFKNNTIGAFLGVLEFHDDFLKGEEKDERSVYWIMINTGDVLHFLYKTKLFQILYERLLDGDTTFVIRILNSLENEVSKLRKHYIMMARKKKEQKPEEKKQ